MRLVKLTFETDDGRTVEMDPDQAIRLYGELDRLGPVLDPEMSIGWSPLVFGDGTAFDDHD